MLQTTIQYRATARKLTIFQMETSKQNQGGEQGTFEEPAPHQGDLNQIVGGSMLV